DCDLGNAVVDVLHRLQTGFIPPTLTGHPESGLSSTRPFPGRFFVGADQMRAAATDSRSRCATPSAECPASRPAATSRLDTARSSSGNTGLSRNSRPEARNTSSVAVEESPLM